MEQILASGAEEKKDVDGLQRDLNILSRERNTLYERYMIAPAFRQDALLREMDAIDRRIEAKKKLLEDLMSKGGIPSWLESSYLEGELQRIRRLYPTMPLGEEKLPRYAHSSTIWYEYKRPVLVVIEVGYKPEWVWFKEADAEMYISMTSGKSLPARGMRMSVYSPHDNGIITLESIPQPPQTPQTAVDTSQQQLVNVVTEAFAAQTSMMTSQQNMMMNTLFPLISSIQEILKAKNEEESRGRQMSPVRLSNKQENDLSKVRVIANIDNLPTVIAKIAEREFPADYAKAHESPSYDHEYWTWSVELNRPVYITRNVSNQQYFTMRSVRTPAMMRRYGTWKMPAMDEKYMSDTDPENVSQMLLDRLQDRSPHPRYILESEHNVVAAAAQTAALIRDFEGDIRTIPLVPKFNLGAGMVNKAIYANMYQDGKLDVIQSAATMFDTQLTHYDVKIQLNVVDTHAFKAVLSAYVDKTIAGNQAIVVDIASPIISVIVWFTRAVDKKGVQVIQERPVQIWRGKTTQLPNLDLLDMSLGEMLQHKGYESMNDSSSYELDTSRFRVVVAVVVRTGSGRRAKLYKGSMAELVGEQNLSWAVVYGVKTRQAHSCFVQVLHEFLVRNGGRASNNRYSSLYKEINHKLLKTKVPVSLREAVIVLNDCGLDCVVYDKTGEILSGGKAKVAPKWSVSDTTVRLLLEDGHYLLVLKMLDRPNPDAPAVDPHDEEGKEFVNKAARGAKMLTFYDLETVNGIEGTVPYSNSFTTPIPLEDFVHDSGEIIVDIRLEPSLNIFDSMYTSLVAAGPGLNHICIAYNGSNFDHILFYKYLIQKGVHVVVGANPKGKGQSFTVAIKTRVGGENKERLIKNLLKCAGLDYDSCAERTRKHAETYVKLGLEPPKSQNVYTVNDMLAIEAINKMVDMGMSYVTVWDPAMFIRSSLRGAAESFKTIQLKSSFDHDAIQAAYSEGRLAEWIKANRRLIEEYNKNDVVVLRQLTHKAVSSLSEITKMEPSEIFHSPSISNLAYKLWKKICKYRGQDEVSLSEMKRRESLCVPVSDERVDKIIRGCLIAGRTEGIVGRHSRLRKTLIDAVSLYPTVMERYKFPVGKEKLCRNEEEANDMYMDLVPGIYYCRWDQSGLLMLNTRGYKRHKRYKIKDHKEHLALNIRIRDQEKDGEVPTYENGEVIPRDEIAAIKSLVKPARHAVLPTRTKNGRLDWKTLGCGEGYQPDVTIEQLMKYGASVRIVDPPFDTNNIPGLIDTSPGVLKYGTLGYEYAKQLAEEHNRELIDNARLLAGEITAIVWPETDFEDPEDNRPFKHYVEMLSELKNQQDEYARTGDPMYNPALREMIKMLLNALSGKVIQRNYPDKFVFVKGTKELNDALTKCLGRVVETDEDVQELLDKGLDIEFITTTVDGVDCANVMWKESGFGKKSKPSQLGVFIYAYARAYMYEETYSRCTVYYSDTDSALINVDDYNECIRDEVKVTDIHGNKLRDKKFGLFEMETVLIKDENGKVIDKKSVFDEAIVIAPKTYALGCGRKIVKYRCKGIRESDRFKLKDKIVPISDNKEEFFESLLNNLGTDDKTEVHTWSFARRWGGNVGINKNDIIKLI